MNQTDVLAFKLHAKTSAYKMRVRNSLLLIEDAFASASKWYIAFSGGKDSTCILNLVRTVALDTIAASSIQQWCLPETTSYLATIANLHLAASGSDHGTGWSRNWDSELDIPDGVMWIGGKVGSADKTIKHYGIDGAQGAFVGIRQDESGARKIHIRTLGTLFYNHRNEAHQCYPVGHWTLMDVWAYIFENNLTYNQAYDRMSEHGIPLEKQRVGPLAIEKALGYGQLSIVKRCWPELFNRFAAKYPEAHAYV